MSFDILTTDNCEKGKPSCCQATARAAARGKAPGGLGNPEPKKLSRMGPPKLGA